MKISNRSILLLVLVCLVGAFMAAGFAQEDESGAAAASALSAQANQGAAPKELSLWDLIKQGGWAMWPLGLCSFLLIAMVVMNFLQVNQKKMMPPDAVARIRAAAQGRDLGGVWQIASTTPSLWTDSLAAGLRHVNPEDPAESKIKMEEAIAEAVSRQESQAGFWINFLSLIAGIAPMLGLLGTVSGMIGAFQKIAGGGMGKPELLAGNIGEALMTTATGLVIAIPAMFFFFLFKNILNRIIVRAEENFSIVLDELTGTGIQIVEEEAPPPEQVQD